jgi:hypothetical protein
MAGYVWFRYQEIDELRATLLSQNALQTQLLQGQASDHSLTPHLVHEIGYVLNPGMKRSTFRAYEGDSYRVNSLGLRGEEIEPKRAGDTRILIVGDSVAFGWKLKDEDRLSSILNEYTRALPGPADAVEFFTVAMPGWNVRSEAAFLEHHLHLLDPDLIVWWSIGNDVEDVAGVVPPGILANWASPQAVDQSPFAGLLGYQKLGASFLPVLDDRRAANIDRIASFNDEFDIPVVLLGLPGFLDSRRDPSFDPPWIHIPLDFRNDARWRISSSDRHPSGWANRICAIGVIRKLVQLGILPDAGFAPPALEIALQFEESETHRPSEWIENTRARVSLSQIPTRYEAAAGLGKEGVLYGVGPVGSLSRAGALILRAANASSHLALSLTTPPNIKRYPGSATFTVRGRDRSETHVTVTIDSRVVELSLPLPETQARWPVYEISWLFDYSLCSDPSHCSPGTLSQARFE